MNPIAIREMRAYERSVPLWARRMETVGVVAVALALCVFLVIGWLLPYVNIPLGFFQFETVQIVVGCMYGLVLLRCITAGVGVANRYHARDDLLLTTIRPHTIIAGQWYAAVYRVRGWMVALGLVRMTATMVLIAKFELNGYITYLYYFAPNSMYCCTSIEAYNSAYLPWQIPLAFAFTILLGLFEVWASVGVGLLAGTWFRQVGVAWVAALVLRGLPIALFAWFPTHTVGYSLDWLVVRWYEYSWFAFADGGTTALLRLTLPIYSYTQLGWYLVRALLPFLAAIHMLLVYGVGAYALSYWHWRRLRASVSHTALMVRPPELLRRRETVLVISASLSISMLLLMSWINSDPIPPNLYLWFYSNPNLLDGLQVVMGAVIATTALRAIIAGVADAHHNTIRPTAMLDRGLAVCRQLRGWWLGLGIVLMTGFGALIAEQQINTYRTLLNNCKVQWAIYGCDPNYFGGQVSQVIFALGMTIALSCAVVFSGVILGLGAGTRLHSPTLALSTAFILRVIPVVCGLLLPDSHIPTDVGSYSFCIARWMQDPLMIVADSGTSALLGMAEAYWNIGALSLAHTSYSGVAFVVVMYMLLGYVVLGVVMARGGRRKAETPPTDALLRVRTHNQTSSP
jgi:hypothetical protein